MTIKFSEDLVPLTDLKVNPGRMVKHVTEKNHLCSHQSETGRRRDPVGR